MPTLENQTLKAIQTSKAYLKKQLQNTTDEHIQQKIQHYIDALTKEETEILKKNNLQDNLEK